jgi:hypothetical protein
VSAATATADGGWALRRVRGAFGVSVVLSTAGLAARLRVFGVFDRVLLEAGVRLLIVTALSSRHVHVSGSLKR